MDTPTEWRPLPDIGYWTKKWFVEFLRPSRCSVILVDEQTIFFLLFWHAPLRVCSTMRRHQPPQRAVLAQVYCFVHCEVVDSQISVINVFVLYDICNIE